MPRPIDDIRLRLSFAMRKIWRGLQNRLHRRRFAAGRNPRLLSCLVKEHRLPIYRRLPGVDPELFENKRRNLELAIARIDGITIPAGKYFSFWQLVGDPTSRRGYLEGLVLRRGKPGRGVGGGLCQLANALFWLALHSDLRVVERHHHSLDLFPDDHRIVPFGTGATIVYNFKDLRFFNPGPRTYQFSLKIDERELQARLFADVPDAKRYLVREADHSFIHRPDGLYRKNTILREIQDATGRCLATETLFQNFSKCQYTLQEAV